MAVLSHDLVILVNDLPYVRHMELQPLQPTFRYRRPRRMEVLSLDHRQITLVQDLGALSIALLVIYFLEYFRRVTDSSSVCVTPRK
jgi:hypothetical protein